MSIDGIQGSGVPRPTGSATRSEDRGPKSGGDRATGDRLELSPRAREISRLSDAAAALPEQRSERVAALRESIASGTYRVDSRAVARAILEAEDVERG